jgi:Coenzyme PQQ synthesis protein D (PqqD)
VILVECTPTQYRRRSLVILNSYKVRVRKETHYMNIAPYNLPRGRKRQLITKEVAGELIVYDLESDRVHCLNATAAFIWANCDGRTNVATIARLLEDEFKIPVEQDIVLYALDQLNESKLLDESYTVIVPENAISRRAVMRLAAATALTLPLISSIVAPTAAQAASCLPSGSGCASDSACCSNNCVDNGRGGLECA